MKSLITSAVVVVAVVFPLLSTAAVALRFQARKLQKQKLKADDWTVVAALIMCWGQAFNVYVTAHLCGVNHLKIHNPIEAASTTLRSLWISSFFFYAASTFVKVSIVLFYKRIFTTLKFQIAAWTMIALLIIWGIGISFALLFTAWPITDAWNVTANHYKINLNAFHISQGWTSLILDIIVLLLPAPMIKALQMPIRRKILIMMIFWLGAFCCIAAAVRLYYLYAEVHILVGSKGNAFSAFPKITVEWIWSKVEPNTSVIAACLPCYGRLFKGRLGTTLGDMFNSFRSFITLGSQSSNTTVGRIYEGKDQSGSMKEGLTTRSERIEMSGHFQDRVPGSSQSNTDVRNAGVATDLESGIRV